MISVKIMEFSKISFVGLVSIKLLKTSLLFSCCSDDVVMVFWSKCTYVGVQFRRSKFNHKSLSSCTTMMLTHEYSDFFELNRHKNEMFVVLGKISCLLLD